MAEWISVEDRLPEDGSCVLVCFQVRDGSRCISAGNYSYYLARWIIRDIAQVTHWMPLPEMPKEG